MLRTRRWMSTLRWALVAALVAQFVPTAAAQTWTGLAASDSRWTTAGNWSTAVPGASSTATFNGPGNGNTSISLGGATQPVGSLRFEPGAVEYTLGVLGSG